MEPYDANNHFTATVARMPQKRQIFHPKRHDTFPKYHPIWDDLATHSARSSPSSTTSSSTSDDLKSLQRRELKRVLDDRAAVVKEKSVTRLQRQHAKEIWVARGVRSPTRGALRVPVLKGRLAKHATRRVQTSVGSGGQATLSQVGGTVFKQFKPLPYDKDKKMWTSLASAIRIHKLLGDLVLAPHGILTEVSRWIASPLHYAIMPHVPAHNLKGASTVLRAMSDTDLKQLMAWFLLVVHKIHETDTIHRDLKVDNVLLYDLRQDKGTAPRYFPLICDFDSALYLPQRRGERLPSYRMWGQTPLYMSPEALSDCHPISPDNDWWSAAKTLQGIVILRLLDPKLPAAKRDQIFREYMQLPLHHFFKERTIADHEKENLPHFKSLISKMLRPDHHKRWTSFEKIRNHPFFQDVTWALPDRFEGGSPPLEGHCSCSGCYSYSCSCSHPSSSD